MTTIVHKLLELYKTKPHSIALNLLFNKEADQVISYSNLIHGSAGYAKALNDAGIKPGEVVIACFSIQGPPLEPPCMRLMIPIGTGGAGWFVS